MKKKTRDWKSIRWATGIAWLGAASLGAATPDASREACRRGSVIACTAWAPFAEEESWQEAKVMTDFCRILPKRRFRVWLAPPVIASFDARRKDLFRSETIWALDLVCRAHFPTACKKLVPYAQAARLPDLAQAAATLTCIGGGAKDCNDAGHLVWREPIALKLFEVGCRRGDALACGNVELWKAWSRIPAASPPPKGRAPNIFEYATFRMRKIRFLDRRLRASTIFSYASYRFRKGAAGYFEVQRNK